MARLKEPDPLPAEAKRSKERIEKDSARVPCGQCAKCAFRQFYRHQRRRRWFVTVIERIVWPMRCVVIRWCCWNCGATFTQLSPLCVPFKRYLRRDIQRHAQAYVETDPLSYRQGVKERGLAVVYSGAVAQAGSTEAEKEKETTPELQPSTLHRWIGAIAAGREQWQAALKLAQQVDPEARLGAILIPAAKYRSAARKRVLEVCGLLLRALNIVASRNPTQLATLGSSP